MKKSCIILILVSITTISFAQKHNIVNASLALKHAKAAKGEEMLNKLIEAKKYIDEAYTTESTANDPKMWNYRAPIYLEIAQKKSELDKDAVLKATEAYLRCLQTDHKGRVIVKKWTTKEEVLFGLVKCGYTLFNKAVEEYNSGQYKRAIKLYDTIFEIIPHDDEDQLKRANITKETIYQNSFLAARKMKDNNKSKELLQKLIDLNFNDPSIYISMSNIYLEEGNTDKAIEYLALGREMFEDEQRLIDAEISVYTKLGRTSELIEKLTLAIESDPENDNYLIMRGTCFQNTNQMKAAESDYILAINLNPASFVGNYNLGALYFNYGVVLKDDASETTNNSKYTKLMAQARDNFLKAVPYLEVALVLEPSSKSAISSLKQLYALNGDYDKSNEMKKLLTELE